MTKSQLERRVHLLTAYAVGSSLLIGILLLGGFGSDDVVRHDKVIAERLEVVESDGDPVLVAANPDRFPRAKQRAPDRVPAGEGLAGMIFYDGDGEEIGALSSRVVETDSGRYATVGLQFDRFGSNNVVGLGHEETPSFRATGLRLNQQVGALPGTDTRRRATLASVDNGLVRFELRDEEAQPRIRMEVDSSGTAHLVFLGEEGEVTHRYPPKN